MISASEEKLKYDIKFLAQKFASSDLTRQACEAECQKYIGDDNKEINVAIGCPLACAGYVYCICFCNCLNIIGN